MSTICVTGSIEKDVNNAGMILKKAGVIFAKSYFNNFCNDINFWHDQVQSFMYNSEAKIKTHSTNIDRIWHLSAHDILLANSKYPLWGWADHRSLQFLDFWKQIDNKIFFLLVCASKKYMLARAMEENYSLAYICQAQNLWQVNHQIMLQFHLQNPSRSLLVDAFECVEHPLLLLDTLTDRFEISFSTESTFQIQDFVDPFYYQVATELCFDETNTSELQNKIENSITRLCVEALPEAKGAAVGSIFDCYQKLISRSQGVISRKDEEEWASFLYREKIEFIKGNYKKNNVKMYDLKLKELEQIVRDVNEENDYLLLSVHSLQEELESYTCPRSEIQDKSGLYNTFSSILLYHPLSAYYHSLEVSVVGDKNEHEFSCLFDHLVLCGKYFSMFVVKVIIEDNIAGFVFNIKKNQGSMLDCFFPTDMFEGEVVIYPTPKSCNFKQRFLVLKNITLVNWSFLKILACLILKSVANNSEDLEVNIDIKNKLVEAINMFLYSIPIFSAEMRYQRVELVRELVNQDYEHLWMRLVNLSTKDKQWEFFEFRVSCANVCSGFFGAFPKLEFPETSGQAPFESWFVESTDDFGSKLELRFSLPYDMDMHIWDSVSINDKFFLTELINILPRILWDIQNEGFFVSRSWDDWTQMAHEIRRIFFTKIKVDPIDIFKQPFNCAK